ncbi:Hpt domain-containing protein [Desulfolithobacter sp.]
MADLQWNRDFALEQTGGDEELLKELVGLFMSSSAEDLEKIKNGVATGNPEEVSKAAHSIKGASASLGIDAIRELALAMEEDARQGSISVASNRLAELEELLLQVQDI